MVIKLFISPSALEQKYLYNIITKCNIDFGSGAIILLCLYSSKFS